MSRGRFSSGADFSDYRMLEVIICLTSTADMDVCEGRYGTRERADVNFE